jgi:hypothetical protein
MGSLLNLDDIFILPYIEFNFAKSYFSTTKYTK